MYVPKLSEICPKVGYFCAANFLFFLNGEGPQILTQFYKLESPPNVVTIDRGTSESGR